MDELTQVFSLKGQGVKNGNVLLVRQWCILIIAALLPSTDLQSSCHFYLLGDYVGTHNKAIDKHRLTSVLLATFTNLNRCKSGEAQT